MSSTNPKEQSRQDHDLLRVLLESSTTLISQLDLTGIFTEIVNWVRRLQYEMTALSLLDQESLQLEPYAAAYSASSFGPESVGFSMSDVPIGEAFRKNEPVWRHGLDAAEFSPEVPSRLRVAGIRSIYAMPLIGRRQLLGVLAVGSTREQAFTPDATELLRPIAAQVAIGIENARNYELA